MGVYQAMYHGGYTRLCTTVGIPGYVPRWVYQAIYHPGYVLPVYHPGYTLYTPRCRTRYHGNTSRDGCTALSRGVTEQTVSVASVTVRPALPSPVSLLGVVLPEAQRGLLLPKNC